MGTYVDSNCLLENFITKDYKNVVNVSMRNPNITSDYLCVETESWITKYVREWLTTRYEYFLLPFKKKKQLSMMLKSLVVNLS
jgi:hypothetical protein